MVVNLLDPKQSRLQMIHIGAFLVRSLSEPNLEIVTIKIYLLMKGL